MEIAIIEKNEVYRESLRTVLDQIQGFHVAMATDAFMELEKIKEHAVLMILLDYSIGKTNIGEILDKAKSLWPSVQFLILINKEESGFPLGEQLDVILKNSGKGEFEKKIRNCMQSKGDNFSNK